MNGYIIFSDLKNFSKLSESEIKKYFKEVLPELSKKINKYRIKAKVWNTWGDAIIAIFEDGEDACKFALALRDFFRDYSARNTLKIVPRIGGHFGEFELIMDPLTDQANAFGSNINTTARIEPITRPGEIFVTKSFKDSIERLTVKIFEIDFNPLGIISMAKNFGEQEIYRLYWKSEKPNIIDKILKEDFSWALPEPRALSENEKKNVTYYNNSPSKEELLKNLDTINPQDCSGAFIFELAKVCKNYGLYEKAVEYSNNLEQWYLHIDGMTIYPYRGNTHCAKIKANALTRLGDYEAAANILYTLWKSGQKDPDTLSMLAAQYKRKALFINNQILSEEKIDKELLNRAIKLYIEAFRLDISNYYPLINAAYLYKIIGGIETGRGNKLAQYILDVWENRRGENWWLDTTLAEAEMLIEDYELAINKFSEIIKHHKPSYFEMQATKEQLFLYSSIKNIKEIEQIIDLFNNRD